MDLKFEGCNETRWLENYKILQKWLYTNTNSIDMLLYLYYFNIYFTSSRLMTHAVQALEIEGMPLSWVHKATLSILRISRSDCIVKSYTEYILLAVRIYSVGSEQAAATVIIARSTTMVNLPLHITVFVLKYWNQW